MISDVSDFSDMTRRNVTINQEWLRIPFTAALETAKQRLVTLAAQLKRYDGENKACTVNKIFSTDVSKVYTMLRNGNQRQADPSKKEKRCSRKGSGRRMLAKVIRRCG